jgi:hypothetical protein
MALKPPIFVNPISRVKRPIPSRMILWPTALGYGDNPDIGCDSEKFPKLPAIKARRNADPVAPLVAFTQTAATAQDRLWVLDDHLFNPLGVRSFPSRIAQILDWFPLDFEARSVRLLTSSPGNHDPEDIRRQFDDRALAINRTTKGRNVTIEIRFNLATNFPYVHDRFAILDDELWHFGASVGGLHHQVNAATRGWDIDDHGAIEFFETAWAGDRDTSRQTT